MAFLRGIFIVMIIFIVTLLPILMIQYVQDNLPENISSALVWTVILIIVDFCSFLGAKQTQKKVYSLVWEDAYYSMQAERTKMEWEKLKKKKAYEYHTKQSELSRL